MPCLFTRILKFQPPKKSQTIFGVLGRIFECSTTNKDLWISPFLAFINSLDSNSLNSSEKIGTPDPQEDKPSQHNINFPTHLILVKNDWSDHSSY